MFLQVSSVRPQALAMSLPVLKQPQSHAIQAKQQHCYMSDCSQYDRRCEIGANCSKRSDSGWVGVSAVGSIIYTSPFILQPLPSRISNVLF